MVNAEGPGEGPTTGEGRRRTWHERARSVAALPELRQLRRELAELVRQKARLTGLRGTAAERLRDEIESEIRRAWRVLGLAALGAPQRQASLRP